MGIKAAKKILCVIGIIVIIILLINLTIPEKLVRMRIDSAEPYRIDYTIVSWSFRPYMTGLEKNVTLFKAVDGQWVAMGTEDDLYHDIGISYPPFSRVKSEYISEKPLETGTYKLYFEGFIGRRRLEMGTEFEIKM